MKLNRASRRVAGLIRIRPSEVIAVCLCFVPVIGLTPTALAAKLVGYWTFDETGPPFSDSSGSGAFLNQDLQTTPPITGPGVVAAGTELAGTELNWQTPGIASRLYVTNAALQTDSFGFSFWMRPVYLDPGDNLIGKEMPYTTARSGSQRMAWQVRLSNTNASGNAPLEFIVRGDNPTNGNFFGSVLSSIEVPLFTNASSWFYVAGGYDAITGGLTLFVNGVQATATNGVPGAQSSDGTPFDVGSVKNGSDFVALSPVVYLDDLQLYNGPLTTQDVTCLMANPGHASQPYIITALSSPKTNGDVVITFNSTETVVYNIEASTNLTTFISVATPIAVGDETTVTIPKSSLSAMFGPKTPSALYFRVSQLAVLNGCN